MAVVLGVNAFHSGASACIVVDGVVLFAVSEERINRIKYYAGFPYLAIEACLKFSGMKFQDIDYIAVGRNRYSNLYNKILYTVKNPSKFINLTKIRKANEKICDIKTLISECCGVEKRCLNFKFINVEHHMAHIASSYFISPWDRCAGISMDGMPHDFLFLRLEYLSYP